MKTIFLLILAAISSEIHLAQSSSHFINDVRNQKIDNIQINLNGNSETFLITENKTLSKEIRLNYPNLFSYDITDQEKGETIGKLTLDENSAYAIIKKNGDFYHFKWNEYGIQEVVQSEFQKSCNTQESKRFFGQNHIPNHSHSKSVLPDNLSFGDQERTFRIVIIGTGEYTAENGGSSSAAMTAATNTLNGLNLIYKNELNITFTLVNSQFYTNENTDPFDPNGDSRLNQASEAMAMNFSDNTYDIGHVFHYHSNGGPWSTGGIAGLGVVCDNGTFFSTNGDSDGLTGPNKGSGWSGGFENISNGWLQLVAHEIGHQFDGLHTFNGNGNSNCNNNISSTSAYEIGSGTTIMSYNGLCSSDQNVPANGESDNYFHSTSLDRMRIFINSTSCSSANANGNNIPQSHTNQTSTTLIPIGTPFELTGVGTDSDDDDLSFQWEQIDEDGTGTPTHGFIGSTAANSTIAPLFKSVPPSESPTRIFPDLSNILAGANENQDFEALPQVSRIIDLNFIVRDNNGGVSSDGYQIESSSSAGPFHITSHNTSTSWTADGSSTTTITWDVSNTDNAIINCQEVDILFSSNNGISFSTLLAENTANDGSETIVIPNLPTAAGRIKIKASNNVFFDINDSPIEITSDCAANGANFSPNDNISTNVGDAELDLSLTPNYGTVLTGFSGTLDTSDEPTSLVTEVSGNCLNFTGNMSFGDGFPFQVDTDGTYTFSKSSGGFGLVVHIYEGDYTASSPCTNWLAGSFDSGTNIIENGVSAALSPGITYNLVIAGFNSSIPALPTNYEYIYSGPGNCVSGELEPSGFDYSYIIVNNANSVMEITADPDMTSYSGGIYTIYGFSFQSGLDLSGYIGISLSLLQEDLLSLTTCGNLSTNQITVEIFGNNCPADLNYDGAVTAADLTVLLSDFGCLVNCVADLTGDGQVTAGDLTIFLSEFGSNCQ